MATVEPAFMVPVVNDTIPADAMAAEHCMVQTSQVIVVNAFTVRASTLLALAARAYIVSALFTVGLTSVRFPVTDAVFHPVAGFSLLHCPINVKLDEASLLKYQLVLSCTPILL
jgi:hypothetical protein